MRTLLIFALLIAAPAAAARAGHARDLAIPDPQITPGVATLASLAEICGKKWGTDRRHVTPAMLRQVWARYGLKGNFPTTWCKRDKHGRVFEVDHKCSRENGGADLTANLWPQCYSGVWSAVMKDRLENFLHREACGGRMTLEQVQEELCIAPDWRDAFIKHFGNPYPGRKSK